MRKCRLPLTRVQLQHLEMSLAGFVVDHISGGGSFYLEIIPFSQEQHQSHVLNLDDIEAMDIQLLEYADASSLNPEQRQHALRILIQGESAVKIMKQS